MIKLPTIIILVAISFGGFAQINTTTISKKSNNTVLKHDSILLKSDNTNLGKPELATGNIRICAPSRSGLISKPPLFVIKYGKKEVRSQNSSFMNLVSPNDIQGISVLKDSAAAAKYGIDANNGVVEITVKESKTSFYRKKFKEYKKLK